MYSSSESACMSYPSSVLKNCFSSGEADVLGLFKLFVPKNPADGCWLKLVFYILRSIVASGSSFCDGSCSTGDLQGAFFIRLDWDASTEFF